MSESSDDSGSAGTDRQPGSAAHEPVPVTDFLAKHVPKALDAVTKEKRKDLSAFSVVRAEVSTVRCGPLPCPDDLAAYNTIIPDGAHRIMQMAEAQSAHRIEIEKVVITSQQAQATRGQWFGFLIGLAGLGCGTTAAMLGQPWARASIAGTTLVGLVSAFLFGRQKVSRTLAERRPDPPGSTPVPKEVRKRRG